MQITLNHLHDHLLEIKSELQKLGNEITKIQKQNKKIMTKQEQLQASLDEIAQATTDIGNRIQALIDAGADSVTQESLDALQADADALKAMGSNA